jgi:hypothetical protein
MLKLVAGLLAGSDLNLAQSSETPGERACMHGHSLLQVNRQQGEQLFSGAATGFSEKVASMSAPSIRQADEPWISGAKAPLNEAGYRSVAHLCCRYEMAVFVERAAKQAGYDVCHDGGIQSIVWWFDCPRGMLPDLGSYAELLKKFGWGAGGECSWLVNSGSKCIARNATCPPFQSEFDPTFKPPQPCRTTTTSVPATSTQHILGQTVQGTTLPVTTTSMYDCIVRLFGYRGWQATFTCCEPGKSEHKYLGGKWYRDFQRAGAVNDDTKRLNVFGHNCKAELWDGGTLTGWHATFPEGNYTPAEYRSAPAFKGVSAVKVVRE